MTKDGDHSYAQDESGNRIDLGYPGGVVAHYTFDFADRESTLEAEMPDTSVQSIVTASTYYPFGPLRLLELGNGVVEEHRFDTRYFPDEIEVTAQKSHLWAYTVDGVGNPTEIEETESCLPTLTLSNQALTGTKTLVVCDELTASPDVTIEDGADVTFAAEQVGLGTGFSVAQGALFSVVAGEPTPVVETRTYGYQDYQYFLTSADGAPWGSLDWTYDRIGNRLSEDRNTVVDTYTYVSNGSGNTAKLSQAGSRVFAYDNAGNTTSMTAGANQINYTIDDASRIAEFARPVATAQTTLTYDGRSFLTRSEELLNGGPDLGFAEPTYTSEGTIHSLHRQSSPTDPEERTGVFYFAGRPVAQRYEEIGGSATWLFLATDHLMTPILATGLGVDEEWHGPFEPFGHDFLTGTAESALASGVFLRLPGQLEDDTWAEATLGSESFYNVFRWYRPEIGRYSRADPIGLKGGYNLFAYADAAPTVWFDPRGLAIYVCSRPAFGGKELIGVLPTNHAYLWSSTTKTACGFGKVDGSAGNNPDESGPDVDACNYVPGSEGREGPTMNCCEIRVKQAGIYTPILNDCQTFVARALLCAGLYENHPGVPGGRFGLPCDNCNIADPTPPPDPWSLPNVSGRTRGIGGPSTPPRRVPTRTHRLRGVRVPAG